MIVSYYVCIYTYMYNIYNKVRDKRSKSWLLNSRQKIFQSMEKKGKFLREKVSRKKIKAEE